MYKRKIFPKVENRIFVLCSWTYLLKISELWYNSDVVRLRNKGREIRTGRIQICVRVMVYGGGH